MRTRQPVTQLERRAYFRACMRVSLLKRWTWIVLIATVSLLVLFVQTGSLLSSVAAALVTATAASVWIAWSSYQRHRRDLP